MGFYTTETCPKVADLSSHRHDLPSKNRVGGFRRSSPLRTGRFDPQPLETVSETAVTVTINVSGISCWLSRDPIAEEGGLNLYGFVENDPINYIDLLGLVEYDFQPHSPVGAPWSFSDVIPGAGQTVARKHEIVCVCEQCQGASCYQIKCKFFLYHHIYIHRRHQFVKEDVYGHEQRHVQSLLAEAAVIGSKLEEYEKRPCRSKTVCEDEAWYATRWFNNQELPKAIKLEGWHRNPSSPSVGKDYPVIGTMPPEP